MRGLGSSNREAGLAHLRGGYFNEMNFNLAQAQVLGKCFVTGHDFSRAANAANHARALAPEGISLPQLHSFSRFTAAAGAKVIFIFND
jgi:hypothetical protein